ncbi:MAG TPA: hypothetical protein VME24_03535 [Alphaproteobacteria bacterium]|nr:hypothetical protein [Alphaproteobacteria bacterium]
MRLALILIFSLGVTILSGCATTPEDKAVRQLNHEAKASGSPYRYGVMKDTVTGESVIVRYNIIPQDSQQSIK